MRHLFLFTLMLLCSFLKMRYLTLKCFHWKCYQDLNVKAAYGSKYCIDRHHTTNRLANAMFASKMLTDDKLKVLLPTNLQNSEDQ